MVSGGETRRGLNQLTIGDLTYSARSGQGPSVPELLDVVELETLLSHSNSFGNLARAWTELIDGQMAESKVVLGARILILY